MTDDHELFEEARPEGRWRAVVRNGSVLLGAAVLVVGAVVALRLASVDGTLPSTGGPTIAAVVPVPEAPGRPVDTTTGSTTTRAPSSIPRVDPAWLDRVATATGIPARALVAYAAADLVIDAEQPECGIGWNTIAGIGGIESAHGTHGGGVLSAAGYSDPAIRGVPLDGDGVAAIADTDDGAWDGDVVWDRAVGPMQFIPGTWAEWGADGNGDGAIDPNQIDDAALATARYLCASGPMSSTQGWRGAVFSFNHLESYVDDVAATANLYADRAASAS